MERPTPGESVEALWPMLEKDEQMFAGAIQILETVRRQLIGDYADDGREWISAEFPKPADGKFFSVSTRNEEPPVLTLRYVERYYSIALEENSLSLLDEDAAIEIDDIHVATGLARFAKDVAKYRGPDDPNAVDFTAYSLLFEKLDELKSH